MAFNSGNIAFVSINTGGRPDDWVAFVPRLLYRCSSNGNTRSLTELDITSGTVFYASSGNGDYADIASFKNKDKIELKGVASNYSLASISGVSSKKSAVGIFTNNRIELIAVVEDGLKLKTNLATDTGFVFV
ncbi:MAG: hypothetical protein V7K25_10955 [Nostoc sp.]|uniref:hypothetical protein n=1 Tax=Nostoc sp. TaxID=1180 RepID=UPI002FF7A3F5